MHAEIELKFHIAQHEISQLIANAPAVKSIRVENIYFDTPDYQLGRQHHALRLRKVKGQCEQTIKTAGTAQDGLHKRKEWNVALRDCRLQPTLFPAIPRDILLPLADALRPIFTTHFTRKLWRIQSGEGVEIECAIDEGEICAGQKTESICELELELKQGSEEDLLAFVYDWRKGMRLIPNDESKAARGYRLCGGCLAAE